MSEPVVRVRVRYYEVDMQGIVFNSHYYAWMDVSHTEWIRERLGALTELYRRGVDVMVAESSCRFRASARFDEEIDIAVDLESLTNTSMTTRAHLHPRRHRAGRGPHPARLRRPGLVDQDALAGRRTQGLQHKGLTLTLRQGSSMYA